MEFLRVTGTKDDIGLRVVNERFEVFIIWSRRRRGCKRGLTRRDCSHDVLADGTPVRQNRAGLRRHSELYVEEAGLSERVP
jgi:hypothetical protein